MLEVNESLTKQVAELARLALSDEEVKTFTHQLGDILKYVEQLQKIDVNGVDPLTHPVEFDRPMREDILRPPPVDEQGKPKVLGSAPEVMDDGFKVPQIL